MTRILYQQLLLLLAGLIAWQVPAGAQDATMSDLRAVVNQLKTLTSYSYQSVTNATFPNGQKDRSETHVYMDGAGKRLCYTTEKQVLLLTSQWAYRADHRQKTVSVFDVVRYKDKYRQAMPELEAVFKANLAAVFMDSVLVRHGKLVSAKKKGSQTTFVIGFPSGYSVEEMVIVYDHSRRLPESIRTRTFYPGDATNNRAKGTTIETVSSHYTAGVPETVFDTKQYFSIQKGKVILSRYPQYKIASVL
ncbi:hypothetical protein [Taibaiella helva]|uniref:hypothetical protein n=1 Tax=Taibaiella helva TaxID=2301235 RepID=UPI0013003A9B|nr:hypothetical protein [Taibaiella helva]